ncbi:cation transporter [Anaerostipes caccae]|uniref:cation transporter n=1 Tax=Anaerostipes caccae TaxID=105841 RepID=UPI0039969346
MKGEKKGIGIFGLTVLGIALNLLLCAVKFGAGAVSHSVTITADGWNSLTDAGTSAITMLGLWAAGCGAEDIIRLGTGDWNGSLAC